MTYQFILMEKKENIGILTINNPKVNALSSMVINELNNAFYEYEQDKNVRVIIITGYGDKSFVAGADIKEFQNKDVYEGRILSRNLQLALLHIETSPKPVIAAINGYCLGGGLELAMACDIRYASESATFGQPEINLALIPGAGGTQRLPRLVGKGKAKEMIYSCKPITANEALEIQLVQKITSPDKLMEKTLELAVEIAKKSPLIVSMAKEAIDRGTESDIESGLIIEADKFGLCFSTADKLEGVKAFIEKRVPIFEGK